MPFSSPRDKNKERSCFISPSITFALSPKNPKRWVSDGSKQGYAWSRCHGRINRVADNFFYRLGLWVASHPKLTLFTSLVLVIACCFGFANFRVESDGEGI